MNSDIAGSKTNALLDSVNELCPINTECSLVVGCGPGLEAGIIARRYAADTLGIDLAASGFDHEQSKPAVLKVMDAESLELEDQSMDFVYSFHALEHVSDPVRALAEMARVLRPGGVFCVGTPNRDRLIGYVGSGVSLPAKIKWNVDDWKRRLSGQWENELGAHAGFSRSGLADMCRQAFGSAHLISDRYYERLGGGSAKISRLARRLGIARYVYPCVYVCGRKQAAF